MGRRGGVERGGWGGDMGLHDSEDDISLVFDGCESNRCDHYDHEIKRLRLLSFDAIKQPDRRVLQYIPNWQMSTAHLQVPGYAGVRSQQGTAKECPAILLRRKY